MASWFDDVVERPLHQYYLLHLAHIDDPFPQKIDLTVGMYRTDESKPWVLPAVRAAERLILSDETLDHEYNTTPMSLGNFTELTNRLLLGEDSPAIKEGRVISSQSLSGTGALKLIAEFLRRHCNIDTIYLSNPGYPVHDLQFRHANFKNIYTYRYWCSKRRTFDFDGMIEDLNNAAERSVVMLQACCHNPTGIDPTREQWKQIAEVIERKRLLPLFDVAYQGFATGDLDEDVWPVRYFVEKGMEVICGQSFAKNFGLYGERIGHLAIVAKSNRNFRAIKNQMLSIIRAIYLTPPGHGARIVMQILSNPQLLAEWKKNVKTMANRLIDVRKALRSKLEKLGTPGDWSHITEQSGMFTYSGLTAAQCQHLVQKYHVYLPDSGRMAIAFINTSNFDYLAKAISETVKEVN